MTKAVRTAFAVAAVVVLGACSSGTSSTAQPSRGGGVGSATPTSPAPVGQAFESDRHGYRVEVPPGWNVTEYDGVWTDLAQFDPGAEVPGEDVVAPPDLGAFLVANSMAIPEGMTAGEWRAAFDAAVAAGFTPDCPGTATKGVVAGVPTTVVEQPCEGSIIVGRSLTHGGRGYYFTTRAPANAEETQVVLEGIVSSIEFVD